MVGAVKVNSEVVGEGPTVVLLHGWGGCIAAMAPVREMLRHSYRVVSLDLPGFGLSERPSDVWGTAEYAQRVTQVLRELDADDVLALVGHSFGGKVAVRLARGGEVRMGGLVLIGTPGVRLPLSPEAAKRISRVKRLRKLAAALPGPLRNGLNARLNKGGSRDYQEAGEMRPILVKTVNEDLRDVLVGITVPTLLMWGERDDAAPLEIGRQMETAIPGAGLVVLEHSGHFPFLDEPVAFGAILASFLGSLRGEAGR